MSGLTEALEDGGFGDRVITDRQMARFTGEGDARRYGLVNRALKEGCLIRIKRVLYALGGKRRGAIYPFAVAQALIPGSYISLETALSHHGWIPEAVYKTASVTPDRKSLDYDTEAYGCFSFSPLATERFGFLVCVDRVELGAMTSLIAQPLRALMDLVAHRKAEWQGAGWLEAGLRVDGERLRGLRKADFEALRCVYRNRRVQHFLDALEADVAGEPVVHRRAKDKPR